MKHELLAGVEYLKEDSSRWGLQDLDPGAGRFYRPGAFTSAPAITYEGDTLAFYAQDTIEFVPNWKLTLGARHDSLDAEYSSLNSPQLDFSETSLRTGLSWHPTEYTHYYISYSDSFSPTADLYQLSGGSFPAERSKVTELGAKWMPMEGDLALRAALYRADKEWERNTDLESSAAILTRKRRTDGLELEVAGRVTPNLEVFSGFSLMDAEILEVAPGADARLEGQRPRNTPKLTFNLWFDLRARRRMEDRRRRRSQERPLRLRADRSQREQQLHRRQVLAQHRARLRTLGRDARLRAEELGRRGST